jgi:hypothetical protein
MKLIATLAPARSDIEAGVGVKADQKWPPVAVGIGGQCKTNLTQNVIFL